MSDFIIKLESICKRFEGIEALKNVSLNIKKGETHAIVGENGAGKSTLMNILCGVLYPDSGSVYFEGQEIQKLTIKERHTKGLAMIHQETNLITNLNVVRNVFLTREPKTPYGFVNYSLMLQKTKEIINELKIDLDPQEVTENLGIADKQLTQIIIGLSYDAKVLVMDEPNSALNDAESANLFRIINSLKQKGVTVIYISHRLEEVMMISDRITILRDGLYQGTINTKESSIKNIVGKMVGHSMNINSVHRHKKSIEESLLKVENLSCSGCFTNISFELGKGEILGVSGLIGSGCTPLAECLIGLRLPISGNMYLKLKKYAPKNTRYAIDSGIVYIPPDRHHDSLLLDKNIIFNVIISNLKRTKGIVLISEKKNKLLTNKYINEVKIKASNIYQILKTLSGGNQQKVVLARTLATNPKLIVCNEATRGIDVGAKQEIYELIRKLASQGVSILFISSEIEEIINLSDRIIVLRGGKLVREFDPKVVNKKDVLNAMLTS